jgi:hypothetical protein
MAQDAKRQLQGTEQRRSLVKQARCGRGAVSKERRRRGCRRTTCLPRLYSATLLGALDELFHCCCRCPPPCIKPAVRKSDPWAARRNRYPDQRRLRLGIPHMSRVSLSKCHCPFQMPSPAATEPHLCPLYALCANLKCFSNTCRVHGARFNFHHKRPAAASTRLVATRDVLLDTKQRKASVPTLAPSCVVVMSQLRDSSAPSTHAG